MKKLIFTALCGIALSATAAEKKPACKSCCTGTSKAALLKTGSATKVRTTVATLKVTGMTCDGCSGALRQSLLKEKGVLDAKVDHKTGQARLLFDAKQTDPKKLEAAISRKGFPAKLVKG